MTTVPVWLAPVAVLSTLAAGAYVTAVLDAAVAAAVAGRRPRLAPVVSGPLRKAALLALQGTTTTERPDAPAWMLSAPLLLALSAAAVTTIPVTAGVAVADLPDGVVLYAAAMALVMVAVFVHGWGPNSVFPLIGGYRFAAQALSYQIALFLVLLAAALPARSLGVGDIVVSQHHLWNVLRQPLGLPIFLVTGVGLSFWGPLALPDAADLAGGTTLEASGRGLLAWRTARATLLTTTAAMGAATFLGGWQGPLLPGWLWMALKTLVLLAAFDVSGHLIPRVRLERFVAVAWLVLIPLALVDVFAAGLLALWTAP